MGSTIENLKNNSYTEGSTSGTTTNSYVDVLTLDLKEKPVATIHIKNTGSTNSIDYELLSYAYSSGSVSSSETSGTLSPGDVASLNISDKLYAKVSVQVKSTTAGSASDYLIEYIQGVS